MRKQIASAAVLAGLGLGVAFGCSAQADDPAQAAEGSSSESMPKSGPSTAQPQPSMFEAGQAQMADATARLEAAFEKQFEQAAIDRAALEKLITEAVQAFPEPARMRVRLRIDEVIETGQKVASQMTPAERTKAVTPVPKEKLGRTQQHLLTGWGWGGGTGFGGFGAFGFPGMYYWGYPSSYYLSYPAYGYYGTGFGCGWGGGWCGTGLGLGGWYW